ncbi:MAG: OmpP1/FadL family transporter [Verrucomicrobiales bacterium]|nr:outer membrane protein transport protein [Verrucomicrobiota bacterium JB025]
MQAVSKQISAVALGLGLCTTAGHATNGDMFIGIGPVSRSMGGTGVASPQDAVSAVFSNPAAMCLSDVCSQPQLDAALTIFMPEPSTSINFDGGSYRAKSEESNYYIPAIGVSFPIGGATSRWRMGFAAYGISGLGVDYRDSAIDNDSFFYFGGDMYAPMAAGVYTDLAIAKVAPSLAYAITPDLSLGASLHCDYATLDLGDGKKNDLGFGIQLGMVWKPMKDVTVGLTYISPQSTTFDNVTDFDGDGSGDSLELEIPQQVAVGVAWTGLDDRLLVELDGRWLNWSNAAGYDEFDWTDQWVVGLGVQYAIVPKKVFLRAGYNFGNNPVNEHNGWTGGSMTTVQGKSMPTYYYEAFRTVGFPAVVEHHMTLGVGWAVRDDLVLNIGWMHAFNNSISGWGTDFYGNKVSYKSELYEDSIELGLTWRY